MRLKNKIAIISGAAGGIGAAVARMFAKEGAKVALGDVADDDGAKLAAEIESSGGKALFAHLDTTELSSWETMMASVVERFGRLDILINNAGIYRRATVEAESLEEWDLTMNVNVKGVFLGTRCAIPHLRAAGGGSIINLSSVAGLIGGLRSTSYNASKGAVRLLTKSTALQYAREGIRCNSVHPAPIETPILDWVHPNAEGRPERESEIPLGRFGTPDEVAYGVLFLASDESSYMTGSELVIDGGLTAR